VQLDCPILAHKQYTMIHVCNSDGFLQACNAFHLLLLNCCSKAPAAAIRHADSMRQNGAASLVVIQQQSTDLKIDEQIMLARTMTISCNTHRTSLCNSCHKQFTKVFYSIQYEEAQCFQPLAQLQYSSEVQIQIQN
jgi:hypothetical protein